MDAYLARLRTSVARASKSEAVTLGAGEQRFIRTYQRKLLHAGDGVFEFRAIVPLPQFALVGGGSIGVAVVLPPDTPQYSVDLLDWTRTPAPQVFGEDQGLPGVGGRLTVAWTLKGDPELALSYRYVS